MDVFYLPVLVLVVGQLNGKAFAGHSLAFIIIAAFFAPDPPGGNKVGSPSAGLGETQHRECLAADIQESTCAFSAGSGHMFAKSKTPSTPQIGKARKSTWVRSSYGIRCVPNKDTCDPIRERLKSEVASRISDRQPSDCRHPLCSPFILSRGHCLLVTLEPCFLPSSPVLTFCSVCSSLDHQRSGSLTLTEGGAQSGCIWTQGALVPNNGEREAWVREIEYLDMRLNEIKAFASQVVSPSQDGLQSRLSWNMEAYLALGGKSELQKLFIRLALPWEPWAAKRSPHVPVGPGD